MINMRVILFFLVFVIVEIQATTTENTNSEDINIILDTLIRQVNDSDTKWNDENSERSEPEQDVPNDAEDKAGNDSNIYYFKTYTAPRIKLKYNVRTSSKQTRYEALSEDKLLPGTPESQSRSGTNNDDIEPAQYKSAENDQNLKLLEDLFEKDIKKKVTTERSPYGRTVPKPLSILHEYPEIIIDHITYNNDEDDLRSEDKNEPQEFPDDFLPNSSNPNKHTQSVIYQKVEKKFPQENTNSEIDPRLKDLFGSILENTEVHNRGANKIAEHQSNKQNILLEKILEQLSGNKKQDTPNLESRVFTYPGVVNPLANEVRGLGLMPTYSQNLQRDVVSTTYIHTPVLAYNLAAQVPIKPYLGRGLLGFSRSVTPQRASLATNLFQRGMPRTNLFQRGMPLYRRNLAMLRG